MGLISAQMTSHQLVDKFVEAHGVRYCFLLFNKLSLCPYMVRKPSISVILHDRYPAIYVNDHIWKCTADFLSLLVFLAMLKSEAVLVVFSVNFNSLEETFHD